MKFKIVNLIFGRKTIINASPFPIVFYLFPIISSQLILLMLNLCLHINPLQHTTYHPGSNANGIFSISKFCMLKTTFKLKKSEIRSENNTVLVSIKWNFILNDLIII